MDSDKTGVETPAKLNRDSRLTERSREHLDAHRPSRIPEARRSAAEAKENTMITDVVTDSQDPARVLVPATPTQEPETRQDSDQATPDEAIPPPSPLLEHRSQSNVPTSQSQEREMALPPRGHAIRDLYAGLELPDTDLPGDAIESQRKFMKDFYTHMRITAEKDAIITDFLDDIAARQQEHHDALILLHNTFKEGGGYADLQEFVANKVLTIDKRINTLNDSVNALIDLFPQNQPSGGQTTNPTASRTRPTRWAGSRISTAQELRSRTTLSRARANAPSPSTVYEFGSENHPPSCPRAPSPTPDHPAPAEDYNTHKEPPVLDHTRPPTPAFNESDEAVLERRYQGMDDQKDMGNIWKPEAKSQHPPFAKSWADSVEEERMQIDPNRIDGDDAISILSYEGSDPAQESHDAFLERSKKSFFSRRGMDSTRPNSINAAGQARAQEAQSKAKDTWVQVARRNANRNGVQTFQNTPPAPPGKGKERDPRVQGLETTSNPAPAPQIINAPEYKIFHVTFSRPVDPIHRVHSQRLFSRIAAIPQDKWKLNCLEVKWTKNGSISLRFPAATHEDALKFHQMNILRTLNHGDADATFTQQHRWSRVTIYNVPCLTEDEDGEKVFVDADSLRNQLSQNFLFSRLNLTESPRWIDVLEHLPPDATSARFGFGFEDPFGDLARDLCGNGFIFIQGTRCPIKILKNKVFVGQCTRCWRLGQSHINCQPRCRLCGGSHPTTLHQDSCLECNRLDNKQKGIECSHVSCANCRELCKGKKTEGKHAMDSPRCVSRSEFVRQKRSRLDQMYEAQRQTLRRSFGRP